VGKAVSHVSGGKKRRAVLITAKAEADLVEIRVDDAQSDGDESAGWRYADHVTGKKFSRESIRAMTLDEKELADFGFYVLSRLSAFIDRGES
jgi:hypothetical protein